MNYDVTDQNLLLMSPSDHEVSILWRFNPTCFTDKHVFLGVDDTMVR